MDREERRTARAMELAAPVYNGRYDFKRMTSNTDPESVKQAIFILRETLDQATHPDHILHGSGILVDLRTRAESFEMRMEQIEQDWHDVWNR